MTRAGALLVLSLTYFAYVFRLPSGEWLRLGLGDWIDPYFINSLLEQWRYCLTHLHNPASPPVFFPARGTIGYSHTLILYAPVYTLARLWLHPFTAYTVTLFAVMEFGTLCLFVVCRRFVRLGFLESVLFTAVFATSGNVVNGWTGVWSQRASIFLVPPILLFGLTAAAWPRGARRWSGLACTGLLATSLLTQDIYTGLLTAVVAAPLVAGARLILGWPRPGIRITIWRIDPPVMSVRRRAVAIAAVAVMVAALAIAWQHAFGHIRHRHPGRALVVAAMATIAFELLRGGTRDRIAVVDSQAASDLAALSLGALAGLAVFTWMYGTAFAQHQGFSAQEMLERLAPITSLATFVAFKTGRSIAIVCALTAAAWLPWTRVSRTVRRCSLWFVLVTLFVLAVPVQIGGFTLWKYAFDWVPGFSAIRDPRRIQYPFELAAALASGLFISQLPRASAARRVLTMFVLAIVIVKWNPERFDYERPRDAFARWVEAPIAVDSACLSFYIKPASSAAYTTRSPNVWALYSNEASFIAAAYGIPTLNGYSAWTPPGWNLNPSNRDYLADVAHWISRNRLEHVCALDIERRTMTPDNP